MVYFVLFLNLILVTVKADDQLVQKVFKNMSSVVSVDVEDTISKDPINTKIYVVFEGTKKIGYYRPLATTTGCDSACLPIVATLFYDAQKQFKTIKSKTGLTKKDHQAFTKTDYKELELILQMNPEEFKKVNHPKEMVDVMSGATKPQYQGKVVKKAAYTSLRLNQYNQNTLENLKKLD